MENTYQQQFQIRSYEIDSKGKIKIATLLNYLQEAASTHAARLGVSVVDLFPKNLTWVLSRYHIQIFSFPSWGEMIQINTWPSAMQNLFALREFELVTNDNERIAIATSSWMLVDFKKKQPVRPAEHLPQFPHRTERVIPANFESIAVIEKADIELPFRVRMADLDLNQHVNNVSYIEWAIEAMPAGILRNYRPKQMEISFRGEAIYGDRVLSRTQILDDSEQPSFLHQIVKEKDNKELTRLRTTWQRFE